MIFIVKLSFSSNYITARSINVLSFFSLSPPLSSSLYLHLPPSLVPAGNSRPCRSESTSRGQGRGPHSWILRFWFWLRFWLSCHSPCASSPGRGKRRGRERRGTECRHWTPLIPSSSLSAEHSVLRLLFLSRSRSVSPPSPYCKTGSVAEQWSCLISIVEMVYPLGKKKLKFCSSWADLGRLICKIHVLGFLKKNQICRVMLANMRYYCLSCGLLELLIGWNLSLAEYEINLFFLPLVVSVHLISCVGRSISVAVVYWVTSRHGFNLSVPFCYFVPLVADGLKFVLTKERKNLILYVLALELWIMSSNQQIKSIAIVGVPNMLTSSLGVGFGGLCQVLRMYDCWQLVRWFHF